MKDSHVLKPDFKLVWFLFCNQFGIWNEFGMDWNYLNKCKIN